MILYEKLISVIYLDNSQIATFENCYVVCNVFRYNIPQNVVNNYAYTYLKMMIYWKVHIIKKKLRQTIKVDNCTK